MFKEMSIEKYSQEVSKKAPIPGGGSVLALVLENACALSLMVINYTIDKKGYEKVKDEVILLQQEVLKIKDDAHNIIDEDAEGFLSFQKVYKSNDENLIDEAAYKCAYGPFRLMKHSLRMKEIDEFLIKYGNKNVASDSEISLSLCEVVLQGSYKHVLYNLPYLKKFKLLNPADISVEKLLEIF